jgi:hypothetical protein
MWISRIARLVGLAAIIAAMLVIPGRAMAARPSISLLSYVDSFPNTDLTTACGFTHTTIVETDVINQHIITYVNGTEKAVEAGPNYISYTTPYGTLTGRIAGFGEITQNPDGTLTIIGVGPGNFTTAPGSGPVIGSSGRFVGQFDPATDTFTVLQDVGIRPSNLGAFCTYLGPPGYTFPG